MKQATLFDFANDENARHIAASAGLVIKMNNKNKEALSKQQHNFNKLTRKIEKLQKELQERQRSLDDALTFYGNRIHPLEQQLLDARIKMVKKLYEYYLDKKAFDHQDRKILKEIMSGQLEDIFYFQKDEPDAELKTIFKEANGKSYERAVKEEMKEVKEDMRGMFEAMGMNVNLDDIDGNVNNEEYWARKMKEIQGEFESKMESEAEENRHQPKSRKQLQKEQKEKEIGELRERNIKSIYKQLVKTLHPDLEQDELRRIEKETVMKQLTVAYENNDLHTLLKLELEWIYKEGNHLNELSNDKLSLYNDALREQVDELEFELFMLPKHPKYMTLQRICENENFAGAKLDCIAEEKKLKSVITNLLKDYETLTEKGGIRTARELIEYWKYSSDTF